jgi:uncharacterized membrane-anchored protein
MYADRWVVFAGALVLIAVAYFYAKISRTLLFWSAFIITRPLGAALGDILTKPVAMGGFNLSRIKGDLIQECGDELSKVLEYFRLVSFESSSR